MAHLSTVSEPLRITEPENPDPTATWNVLDKLSRDRRPPPKKQSCFISLFPKSAWNVDRKSPWNADGKSPDDHARERQQLAQARCVREREKGKRWCSDAELEPSSSPPSGSSSSSPASGNLVVSTSQTSPSSSIGSAGPSSSGSPSSSGGPSTSGGPSSSGDLVLMQRQMEFLARDGEFQRIVDRLADEPLSKVKAEQRKWTDMAYNCFPWDSRGKALAILVSTQLLSVVEQRKVEARWHQWGGR
ncbi:MAG: hypothetical protein L6R37_001076 [Teloschistes peruensis]|nr:MAG: hypothetical protein L6R37_001076 [Teloschistes peruensis]